MCLPLRAFMVERLSLLAAEGSDGDLLFTGPECVAPRSSNFHARIWSPARLASGEPGLRIHRCDTPPHRSQ